MNCHPETSKKHVDCLQTRADPTGSEQKNGAVAVVKRGLSGLALASGLIVSASLNPVHAADGRKMSATDWAATHRCSVLEFRSAKEYNSSSWPWYTYSTCMTESGEKP